MKAVLFVALLVAAATCTNNISIMFEHFNLTYHHLANAVEAHQNRNIFKLVSSAVKAASNWVVYEQDVEDTTPTIASYFNDLGYETRPCYENIQKFKTTARTIYEQIKVGRANRLLDLALDLLVSFREANNTCLNAAKLIATSLSNNNSSPVCQQQKQQMMNFGQSLRNATATETIRARGAATIEAFKVIVACAPRQSSQRIALHEQENPNKRGVGQFIKRNIIRRIKRTD
eukprot:TRINITY_DN2701_c0_g2_i2.p1 TRINITY_DN2701_c0_g2~~TRINITY_DN2701_c0_g2_i2.p1  ORF type:complete len:231 (-),score=66.32 TRINITY_DN2701_c0_g2_i2:161-853(-)